MHASRVLVIDPVAGFLSFLEGAGEENWKYDGICLARTDNSIAPRVASPGCW